MQYEWRTVFLNERLAFVAYLVDTSTIFTQLSANQEVLQYLAIFHFVHRSA